MAYKFSSGFPSLIKHVSCHPGGDEPASWVGGGSQLYIYIYIPDLYKMAVVHSDKRYTCCSFLGLILTSNEVLMAELPRKNVEALTLE